jgi:hypothetical protein
MSESFEAPAMFCYNHPDRPTSLRCNRCERPICASCAVLTPTGYRCKECVRGMRKVFDTARWWDYPAAFIIAVIGSYLGSRLVSALGFFTFLVAPMIGVGIAEVVRFAVNKRRSRLLFQVALAGVLAGCLVNVLPLALATLMGGFGWFSLIWQALYLFLVPSTVYYRLSGIQMRV